MPTTIQTIIHFVIWIPFPGHLKLNVDRPSRDNLGQGGMGGEVGGILCDYRGRIIFAFSHFHNI